MNKKFFLTILFFGLIYFLFNINFVLAAASTTETNCLVNLPFVPCGATPQEYLSGIFKLGLALAGLLAMAVIVVSGLIYMYSFGNPSRQADARDRIYMALLGILILGLSYIILRTIKPELVSQVEPPQIGASPPPPGDGGGGGGGGGGGCPYECCESAPIKSCTDPVKRFCLNNQCVSCFPEGTVVSDPLTCCSQKTKASLNKLICEGNTQPPGSCPSGKHEECPKNQYCDAFRKCQPCKPAGESCVKSNPIMCCSQSCSWKAFKGVTCD